MAKLSEEQRQQRALARQRREALQAEEDDRRDEDRRQLWVREGIYLSYEEFEQGVPCRGCGQPLDNGLGDQPPLLSDAKRAEYDARESAFKERHGDCHAARWSIEGSQTSHCFLCCPPPPMSKRKIEEIRRFFSSFTPTDPRNLDTWELTLTCDHITLRTQHKDHSYWSGRIADCPQCGARRGIVTSRPLGPAGDISGEVERERLESEVQAAEAKLARANKAAAKANERLRELESKLNEAKRRP